MKSISQHIFISRNDVRLTESPFGMNIAIRGCRIEGQPGAPALPIKRIRMALPAQSKPVSLKVEVVVETQLTREKTFVACIQPPRSPYSINEKLQLDQSASYALPDENLYKAVLEEKSKTAVMGETLRIGTFAVIPIDLSPVHYAKDGTLVLVEHLILHMKYEKDDSIKIKPPITSRQRYAEYSQIHDMVINRDLVRKTPMKRQKLATVADFLPHLELPSEELPMRDVPIAVPKKVDYLIITDNQRWNPTTMTSVGVAGDLVSEFQRLATHKKARGYRVHTAQVTDIVGDRYGNFRNGARDLQEILRNFLKSFVVQKGVEFVLLGGDVSIIPARVACGCAWGQIGKLSSLDEDNRSEWKGSYLGMRVDTGIFGLTTHTLTNLATGQIIPHDPSGTSNSTTAGWYHTTNDSFNTRSASQTRWIRVNGPAALVNATLIWYTPNNLIPTDLYYSSLYSSYYNHPNRHDWDLLNNGLYGQHNEADIHLGGVDFSADIRLGRAPVETTDQARIFVDKTITYDKWGDEHISTDYNRFKKMLYVADHWGFHLEISPTAGNTTPPTNNRYSHNSAAGHALLRADKLAEDISGVRVIANISDTLRHVIHYDIHAGAGRPGWYYAKSATDLSPSNKHIDIWFFEWDFPVPTAWVVVYGSAAEITPISYCIDRSETDSSVSQQEELRDWMQANFSRINQVQRLYSDVTDVPTGSVSGAGLKMLTGDNLLEELNKGPHFVSLTGHGNSGWVAHLSHDLINNLTNGEQTFIAIADSCLTNQFDENDALGEHLLYYPNGGAVAYIGNSRYSWIGVGDDFRLEFFKRMSTSRTLAALNDSRCLLRNDTSYRQYKLWTILEQTLMGDPELNVYRTDSDAIPKFIGNSNTMELHRSTCQWVRKMASYHKRFYYSIEEGINLGYDGCAFCLKAYNHG